MRTNAAAPDYSRMSAPREDRVAARAAPQDAPPSASLPLLALVAIWAVNFSVIKVGLGHVAPMAFNPVRFTLASAVVFVALRRSGPIPLPRRADVPRVLALGLLGNLLYQLCFITGISRTRAGNASLLLAGTPILTALLSGVLGHERVRPRVWLGVGLTVAGMALVVMAGGAAVQIDERTLAGDLLLILASVAWSIYTVGARALVGRYGPVPVTAWTMWIGTVGLALVGAPAVARTAWSRLPAGAWASIVYSGALGIGVAYMLWYIGVRRIGNTRTASYSNLVPVAALLVAWAWLGEVPTVGQVAGAVVIIAGVTLANFERPRARLNPGPFIE